MKKQLRIFLAGMLLVAPFGVTVWVIVSVSEWLDSLASVPLEAQGIPLAPGVGALIVLAAVYVVGLLTHLWVFRWGVEVLEGMVSRVPGVKTIYESVRDLLKLFGGDAKKMGKAVLYTPAGSDMTMLAIMTNNKPGGFEADSGKVAIYLPCSYMLGGITVYVPADCVCKIDVPVEEVLKLCATAQVTANVSNQSNAPASGSQG